MTAFNYGLLAGIRTNFATCFSLSVVRHCLSPYGEACYECALSKGNDDDKGVPLVERNETRSQFQSSPPYRIVPASSGGYRQQFPYGGNRGYGQQQQQQQGLAYQSQSYNQRRYGQQNWQTAQQNNGFQYSFTPSGSQRKRRSARHRMEKFTIQIPANITSAKPILTLVPVLSEFNGTFNYVIVHGNTSLFKVEENKGVSFLYIKTPLHRKGVYRLWIKGVVHEPKEKETDSKSKNKEETQAKSTRSKKNYKVGKENGTKTQRHPLGYNEAKKFSLHLVIKAV